MIPKAYIQEWSEKVPWKESDMVEQDLVICRALVAIYNDPFLAANFAFRGGTAIHKLFLSPQPRYSEDIDLVQVVAGPIKDSIEKLQDCLSFLGQPAIRQKANNNTLVFKFASESMPEAFLKLKIEINCREHFTISGYKEMPYKVDSSWFKGNCHIKTYTLEELLGTKLRALYQRRKGRDLFDLYKCLSGIKTNTLNVIECYRGYMKFAVSQQPSQKQFLLNMEDKMKDAGFLGDTKALLKPDLEYDPFAAWDLVRKELVEKM